MAVIGGGVAGMEAARVCAIRGHEVILYEKNDRLGGNLIPGGVPDFKEDDYALIRWYELQLKQLQVAVNLNVDVTENMVKELQVDELILATGSSPKMLHVEGLEMLTAEEILTKKKDAGKSTIIIGGGLVGCETALWLKNSLGY